VNYIVDHIPKKTPRDRRPGLSMVAETITIHNTGNPSSNARGERAWLTNPTNSRQASFHIAVDENEAVECLPLIENAWHAGDGVNGPGNRRSIGIEICESGDYAKTLRNAAQLVAKMLRERGWGVDRLRRHYDWSGKVCPRLMYDGGKWSGWESFKVSVQAELYNEEDQPMTEAERQVLNNLTKRVKSLEERIEAPAWFVKEFGSGDLCGKINDPKLTAEGWRVLAIGLRVK